MPHVILQLDPNGQWENSESFRKDEDDDQPELFDTKELAIAALNEFLADCNEAVEKGDMIDAPKFSEFNIVPSLTLDSNLQGKSEHLDGNQSIASDMALIKTKYLTGDALTYAVVTLLEAQVHIADHAHMVKLKDKPWLYFSDADVSKDWSIAGPLKNTHKISSSTNHTGFWFAYTTDMNDEQQHIHVSHNELEAIARTFVELKLGLELFVPTLLAAESLALQNPPKRGARP